MAPAFRLHNQSGMTRPGGASTSSTVGEASVTKKFKISGPGASDFLTAGGGVDFPETDSSKGMSQTRDAGVVNGAAQLEPDLEAPDPATTREQSIAGAVPTDVPTTPRRRGGP